jgi:hypothetical protein
MGARDALDGFERLLGELKEQLDTIPVHIQFVGLAVILLVAQTFVSLPTTTPPITSAGATLLVSWFSIAYARVPHSSSSSSTLSPPSHAP